MPPQTKKTDPDTLETKRITVTECKLAASGGNTDTMEFSGYGAVTGNVDSYGDVIEPGAFKNYLEELQTGKHEWPAMLMQHGGLGVETDSYTPIGVYDKIEEDATGLKITGKLAPTQRGMDVYTLMKMQPRPAISGLSIGFYTRKESYGGKNDLFKRKIEQIDVVEISVVTFPANNLARIGNVKSAIDFTEKDFEKFLREAGFSRSEAKAITARGFRAVIGQREADNNELKQLIAILNRNIKILQSL